MSLRKTLAALTATGLVIVLLAGCATPVSLAGDAVPGGYADAPPLGTPTAVDGESYTLSGTRGLTVVVPVGGGCQVTGTASVTAVSQTETEVRLVAGVVRPPSPSPVTPAPGLQVCTDDLILQRVVVETVLPLGERRVVDAVSGLELRRRP